MLQFLSMLFEAVIFSPFRIIAATHQLTTSRSILVGRRNRWRQWVNKTHPSVVPSSQPSFPPLRTWMDSSPEREKKGELSPSMTNLYGFRLVHCVTPSTPTLLRINAVDLWTGSWLHPTPHPVFIFIMHEPFLLSLLGMDYAVIAISKAFHSAFGIWDSTSFVRDCRLSSAQTWNTHTGNIALLSLYLKARENDSFS